MSLILLDTNVVSYLLKQDTRAGAYAPLIVGNRVAISMMTVAELYQWSVVRHWGQHRIAAMESVLALYDILPIDQDTCKLWGQIHGAARTRGVAISGEDTWIAATALQYSIPLITHNVADFTGIPQLIIRTAP